MNAAWRVALAAAALIAVHAAAQTPASRSRSLIVSVSADRPTPSEAVAKPVPHGAIVVDTRTARRADVIHVAEGERTTIRMPAAVPMTFRHFVAGRNGVDEVRGMVTYDAVVQFALRARVTGPDVTVDIGPHDDTLLANAAERERMRSSATGRLGEWMPLGGAELRDDTVPPAAAGTLRAQTRPATNQRGVWLKVEVEAGKGR
jgi:hypothetical protein